ncbi:hypothetical protein NFI96_030660, partial [Prochilodus magdalenae]
DLEYRETFAGVNNEDDGVVHDTPDCVPCSASRRTNFDSSEVMPCYATFSLADGTCSNVLGEVTLEDCCMNPKYGYLENGGCKSCRYAEWTEWSSWSACSVSCSAGVQQRHRACYGIGKCQDTKKIGTIQTKPCKERSCCPVNGGWSEWSPWELCSVTCESGTKIRKRECNNPPPVCGGSCFGDSEESVPCDTKVTCPTHGGWSSWGNWGPCLGTCQQQGFQPPVQLRRRTCTNPPPSTMPKGNDCPGSNTDSKHCEGLPFCAVDGNWGAWSAPSACSVTCGVGQQMKTRKCDSPAPKYGGQQCQGDTNKPSLCITDTSCPSDGHWSEWGEWTNCKSPNERTINCKTRQGTRRRERECLGRDHGGEYCPGEGVDHRICYDIEECELAAYWSEWSDWSYCKPDCGENSIQTRKRECVPDLSKYRDKTPALFSGTPNINCPPTENTEETRECFNLPEC